MVEIGISVEDLNALYDGQSLLIAVNPPSGAPPFRARQSEISGEERKVPEFVGLSRLCVFSTNPPDRVLGVHLSLSSYLRSTVLTLFLVL